MNKNKIVDETFAGVWLWSFLFTLSSVGLPIFNTRRKLGITQEALLPLAMAMALGLIVLIGLAQWLVSPSASPSKNEMVGTVSHKMAGIAGIIAIDIFYSVCLVYLYQAPIEWTWLEICGVVDAIFLFIVFRQFFKSTQRN
jgi:hypothetical protein